MRRRSDIVIASKLFGQVPSDEPRRAGDEKRGQLSTLVASVRERCSEDCIAREVQRFEISLTWMTPVCQALKVAGLTHPTINPVLEGGIESTVRDR
jgi:hypothetical protein